jgi:cyclase
VKKVAALVLFLLSLFFLTISPVSAQDKDAQKGPELKTEKVAENLYTLDGAGGNMAFLVTDDGVLLIDTAAGPIAPAIHAAIKAVSDKPIKYVFNTHYHFDHVASNAEFAKEGTIIIAQENVRKRLATGAKPYPKEAWPTVTFDDEMTLYLGNEEVRFVHIPKAHTDGDGVVWFPKQHVVHMGDELFAGMYPYMDIGAGGNVIGLADAVDKVVAMVPADTKFIAGHGPTYTAEQMKEYSAFLRDCGSLVQAAMKQGKTLEQMQKEGVLAKYEKFDGFVKTPQFTEFVYESLKD